MNGGLVKAMFKVTSFFRELSDSHFLAIFIPFHSEVGQDLSPLSRREDEDPSRGRVQCTTTKLNLRSVTPGS